jgi:hypothetical protein
MNKNDPPHRNESSSNIAQSLATMLWFIIWSFLLLYLFGALARSAD